MSDSSPRRDTWKKFRGNRNAVLGSIIVLFVVLVATLSGVIAPHDYSDTSLWDVWSPPGGEFVLGADELGRDILSRLIVGARVSLTIAGIVLAITMTVGITLGMLAAYHGGWLDTIIMRTVDVIFAFPELIFAILIAAVLGPGTTSVIVALSLVWWPGIARLTDHWPCRYAVNCLSMLPGLRVRQVTSFSGAIFCPTFWRHSLYVPQLASDLSSQPKLR